MSNPRTTEVSLLQRLVEIYSPSHAEAEVSSFLVATMRELGFQAHQDGVNNAIGIVGNGPKTIILLGHIDTVPGRLAVEIREGKLYGRGSVDAKGSMACFVAAAARLKEDIGAANKRIVVIGAVEEEAATSKGARFIAERFNGTRDRLPAACIIGEPSHWRRITLGYKGRLLLDLTADQPMAHTAGPGASVASVVVDLWNWVSAHAARFNDGKDKAFDQLSPSLRRFITSTNEQMHDRVDALLEGRAERCLGAERRVAGGVGLLELGALREELLRRALDGLAVAGALGLHPAARVGARREEGEDYWREGPV